MHRCTFLFPRDTPSPLRHSSPALSLLSLLSLLPAPPGTASAFNARSCSLPAAGCPGTRAAPAGSERTRNRSCPVSVPKKGTRPVERKRDYVREQAIDDLFASPGGDPQRAGARIGEARRHQEPIYNHSFLLLKAGRPSEVVLWLEGVCCLCFWFWIGFGVFFLFPCFFFFFSFSFSFSFSFCRF